MYQNIRSTGQTMLDLARRCKVLRKQKGISQSELAERTKISLSSIKRFEKSGITSLEHLLKIAAVMGRLEDFDHIFVNNGPDQKTIKAFDV